MATKECLTVILTKMPDLLPAVPVSPANARFVMAIRDTAGEFTDKEQNYLTTGTFDMYEIISRDVADADEELLLLRGHLAIDDVAPTGTLLVMDAADQLDPDHVDPVS